MFAYHPLQLQEEHMHSYKQTRTTKPKITKQSTESVGKNKRGLGASIIWESQTFGLIAPCKQHDLPDWSSFHTELWMEKGADKAFQKASTHDSPVQVTGTAPRCALRSFIIICNTQLSLESYKQQLEHSRELQGHELISQPSGAGKWCRHQPLVLEPYWAEKEPCMQVWATEVTNADFIACTALLKQKLWSQFLENLCWSYRSCIL